MREKKKTKKFAENNVGCERSKFKAHLETKNHD